MAKFYYRAKKNEGEDCRGFVEALSQKQALLILKDKELFCYFLREKKESVFSSIKDRFGRISFVDIVNFTRQLATMINAGLPLTNSLEILGSQLTSKMSKVASQILRDVREGESLAASLQKFPKIFSRVYVALVSSGEKAGILDNVLSRLADNLETQREFKGKIKNAMIYPIIVVMMMIAIIFGMMILVIPKLTVLFDEFGAKLPPTTRAMMALSKFMTKFWWLLPVIVFGFIFLMKIIAANKDLKKKIDEVRFKIPVYGKLYIRTILAEFTRTLGLLVNAGISINEALDVASRTPNNLVMEEAILQIKDQVEKGYSVSSGMLDNPLFPPLVGQMIAVGEETAKIDEILAKVSKYYQSESEESLKGLMTALEPLIMVMLGFGVLFIVTAVVMPIYSLTSNF